MLSRRTVLDFVKLIQLALEDNELTTLGSCEIDFLVLVLLERVDHLVEVLILEEEAIIFGLDFQHELLERDSVGILVEVLLQRRLLVFLKPVC